MTNTPTALCHVRPYAGQSAIQTANGNSLPIAAVGDASSTFTNVFLAPQLSTNLISVGQLVDNNCAVYFSGDDCVVQDQVTGEPIAKGPKVGRLFTLFLPIPALSPVSSIKSFACNNIPDLSMVWHRRLGHPNTQILSHVLHSGFLGDKERSSSLSLECDSCKLDKSKTLPFPLHASRASHCFDLIHSDVWGPSPQFSDLHQVSSCFKPGMVYTRRSRPQSLPVAHPISDPNMPRNQSVSAPPEPLVCHSPRVSVPPDRYGFSSGNSLSAYLLLHCLILIFPHATHMLSSMTVGD
ncbi:hypothetical protein F2P56_011695 [Juglans regia]|uniref:GAG-pre-integrase domain-containing protein n=1 Tax=Juglans regia TaxID=51240 RepID=A0A834D1E8_JUGRE|nr:hypothetical protein F2P56_011695 [Juglans regia]